MQPFFNSVAKKSGPALVGVSVAVTVAATGELATIYSDNGVTTQPNPMTTDAKGAYLFYAADGSYIITITGDKLVPYSFPIQLEDAEDNPAATLAELAQPDGAELLGFIPYGAALQTNIGALLRGEDVPPPLPRGFWKEVGGGVNIHRMRDRVFMGAGVVSSGNKFQTANETWLTTQMGAYWFERGAQVLSLSTYGQFGGVFTSRTADQDLHNYGTAAIGVVGLANNDRTNGQGLAWGGYFEVNRQASVPNGQGTSYGVEIAVKNNKDDVVNSPYNRFPGGATVGLWMAGGGDPSYGGAGTAPATAAIVIGKNGFPWNKGLVFDKDGITGTDGVTGTGVAISMAKGHVVEWQLAGALQGATIHSEVTNNAQRTGMQFRNDAVWITAGGSLVGTIEKGAGAANYLRIISAASGAAAQIKAEGTDPDGDVFLNPKGSGAVKFGFWTSSGDVAINGYIGIKDAAGTFRKLATIA